MCALRYCYENVIVDQCRCSHRCFIVVVVVVVVVAGLNCFNDTPVVTSIKMYKCFSLKLH